MPRIARLAPIALVLLVACKDGPTDPIGTLSPCRATDSTVAITSLAVGQVQVVSGNALNCIRLASNAKYLAVVGDVGRAREVATQGFQLGVDLGGAAVSANLTAVPVGARLLDALGTEDDANGVHDRLMRKARTLDIAAARATPVSSPSVAPGIRATIFPSGITPSIGTAASVRIPSLVAADEPCDDFSTISATVRHVSQRAIFMVDNASPANGFSDADFQAIGVEFDNLIYSTDVAYFGTGSDEDANGKIVILYTPEVNKATPRNSGSLLAGFFWAGDLFPRGSCSQSNTSEVFYLLVPDPTGIHSSPRTVADVREKTRGTIAHEFEHMLNAGWRLHNSNRFEAVWLDEAMAHFAEEAVGRAKLGVGDFAELTHTQVFDAGNNLKDYNAFFFQNFARFDDWLRNSGGKAPMSAQADTSLAVRGAAWALLRYAVDHYSGGDARAFMRAFVMAAGDSGVSNITKRVGGAAKLDTALAGWMVANYADNLGIANIGARNQYASWNMRNAISGANNGAAYPLVVQSVGASDTFSGNVRTGGAARYFRMDAGATPIAVQLANATSTAIGFPDARLIILRTQ